MKNFEAFFGSTNFLNVTYNTVVLNAMFIIATMLFSIVIAIAISEIRGKIFKKTVQSVVILPHFISWTVIALLCESLLKTNNGFINNIIVSLGGKKISFFQDAGIWPLLLTVAGTPSSAVIWRPLPQPIGTPSRPRWPCSPR